MSPADTAPQRHLLGPRDSVDQKSLSTTWWAGGLWSHFGSDDLTKSHSLKVSLSFPSLLGAINRALTGCSDWPLLLSSWSCPLSCPLGLLQQPPPGCPPTQQPPAQVLPSCSNSESDHLSALHDPANDFLSFRIKSTFSALPAFH